MLRAILDKLRSRRRYSPPAAGTYS